MNKIPLLDRIKRERAQIEMQRAALMQQLDDLKRQEERLNQTAQELEIAEKVFARYSDAEQSAPEGPAQIPPATKQSKKPDGIPPVSELIYMVLAYAEKEGLRWLEPIQVIERIRGNWWPGAQSNDIAPVLWRMAKQGKLAKRGQKYGRLKENNAHLFQNGLANEPSFLGSETEKDGSDQPPFSE